MIASRALHSPYPVDRDQRRGTPPRQGVVQKSQSGKDMEDIGEHRRAGIRGAGTLGAPVRRGPERATQVSRRGGPCPGCLGRWSDSSWRAMLSRPGSGHPSSGPGGRRPGRRRGDESGVGHAGGGSHPGSSESDLAGPRSPLSGTRFPCRGSGLVWFLESVMMIWTLSPWRSTSTCHPGCITRSILDGSAFDAPPRVRIAGARKIEYERA